MHENPQTEKEKDRELSQRAVQVADIRSVLGTESGRRFIFRILDFCGVYRSDWEPSARIHYNCGRADAGRFIISEMMEADPFLYPSLLKKNISETIKNKEVYFDRDTRRGEQNTNTLRPNQDG